jgi:rSAM/selenodomain-associated transferase 1
VSHLDTLIVFVRAPELGRVKTRLAAELGAETALAIYREVGAHVVAAASLIRDCDLVVAYTPADGEAMTRAWLGDAVALVPQCDGDLGARMSAAVTQALARGAERVVVIGADCPEITPATIAEAFVRLNEADVVLGPAVDGGYYLIGLTRPYRALFADIPWSSRDTLSRTLTAARRAGLTVSLLDVKHDVDTADDWRRWRAVCS